MIWVGIVWVIERVMIWVRISVDDRICNTHMYVGFKLFVKGRFNGKRSCWLLLLVVDSCHVERGQDETSQDLLQDANARVRPGLEPVAP
eukprot:6144214-Amphidinium_carterae.1